MGRKEELLDIIRANPGVVNPKRLHRAANPAPLEKGAGKGRKTKLAAIGLSLSIIKEGDQSYAACLDQANKYRKTRMRELAEYHGHVSAGVGALLATASLALAASRYLYQRAAAAGDSYDLKQASALADSARQAELAAWELCGREGVLKRRQDMAASGQPWLLTNAGEVPKKAGRKTNLERQARAADVPPPGEVESNEEVEDEQGRPDDSESGA